MKKNELDNLVEIINLQAINLPTFNEVRGKDWVRYGQRNEFPQLLIDLLQQSAIHGTAIQAKLDATKGEGVVEIGNDIVNTEGETINEIYEKIAYDYNVFNGYALNVIWNRAGDKIVEIYHLPFANVRSGKLDENDKVNEYFYSSNWDNIRKYKPVRYPALSMTENRGDDASQIFYFYDYSPASDIYPLPSYMGALNDIDLDSRISKFHNANISNGMSPSLMVNFPNGKPTADQKRRIHDDMNRSFSGENNAGRVFITFSDGADRAPQVTPIQSANDSYYVVLEERISSRILTAHRITSPLLIGIRDGSGLGNNAQEIETAYTHFMSSVIQPIQKSINKSLGKITRLMGIEVAIEVQPAKLDFNENIDELENNE